MNNKGQTAGLITGIIFGVASLVIAVIIAFIIVSTLTDADLLTADKITVLNEAGHINGTTYTLDGASDIGATGYVIVTATNLTDDTTVPAGNYTVSASGVVSNLTAVVYPTASFNYTYSRDSGQMKSTDGLAGNMSEGIDNVSDKIPTVLLIAVIVLLLGILAILVGVWQRMRIGGSL